MNQRTLGLGTVDLMVLVEAVARHYQCPPDEVELMKRLARANPEMHREGLLHTVKLENIPLTGD